MNDFDQTLLANGLTNGAQLTMKSGSVAPRNHVRLKIFKIINKYYKPNEASMKEFYFYRKTKRAAYDILFFHKNSSTEILAIRISLMIKRISNGQCINNEALL